MGNTERPPITLRSARPGDAGAVSALFLAARRAAMPYLPRLHSAADTHDFLSRALERDEITVAEDGARVVGFVAVNEGRVEHLYVAPAAQRRGVGSALLRHAQRLRPQGLDLFVFQRNGAAIAFYATHGFAIAETTDGAGNEEREPDARMTWPGARA